MLPKYLYNISRNTSDDSHLLTPYIPASAAHDEDQVTPRVCFADSIEHCISAISPEFRDISEGTVFRLRVAKTCNMNASKIIPPGYLTRSGKVPDAIENHEYWYLESIEVTSAIHIIDSCDFERDIAWSIVNYADVYTIMENIGYTVPGSSIPVTAQSLYHCCMKYYNDSGLYDAFDQMDEDVAALPWAQHLTIKDLKTHFLSC